MEIVESISLTPCSSDQLALLPFASSVTSCVINRGDVPLDGQHGCRVYTLLSPR